MKEKVGKVYSIAEDNKALEGCTVSKEVYGRENYIAYFSMAEDTDISAELFPYYKLLIVAEGEIEAYGFSEKTKILKQGDSIFTPIEIPVGIRTKSGAIFTEIAIKKEDFMNKAVKPGEVFKLGELLEYQEGKIVNMDVVHNDQMKFVLMAFDAGTGLSEHSAPGEAIVFALDGEGIIGYEGTDHVIKAGECFHFAKAGRHYVKAVKNFKMALLLTLE